jgi:beta-glucosidase
MTIDQIVNDVERQTFYTGYIRELAQAVRDEGINIGAYMAWSLLE